MVDRLSNMPQSLQLHILSFLETKHAVTTSLLSKAWVSLWTYVPALNFSSHSFEELDVFDKFVVNALEKRQPVKLDRLTFTRHVTCNPEMLKKVFDYALLHGVEEVEAHYILPKNESWSWPIRSSDSLTSLKLQIHYVMGRALPETRYSGSFKNLTNLHLEWVVIRDLDPFSGFPVLNKLRMVYCYLETNGKALNVHAPQLTEFTYCHFSLDVGICEFTTPKLRYFNWRGNGLPCLKAHLPVVDTVVINYDGGRHKNQERIMFDNLLMMFDTLYAAKSLTISAYVVRLLASFPVSGCSPFRDLKCLNLDFFRESMSFFSETMQFVPGVKAYLLNKSHDAKFTIIN